MKGRGSRGRTAVGRLPVFPGGGGTCSRPTADRVAAPDVYGAILGPATGPLVTHCCSPRKGTALSRRLVYPSATLVNLWQVTSNSFSEGRSSPYQCKLGICSR